MEHISEHTGLISSLSLLLVQTQGASWKAAAPQQLTGSHLYLDIANSGYLFHGYSGGMGRHFADDISKRIFINDKSGFRYQFHRSLFNWQ